MSKEPTDNRRGEVLEAMKKLKVGCVHTVGKACPHLVDEKRTYPHAIIWQVMRRLNGQGNIREIGRKGCKESNSVHKIYEFVNVFKPSKGGRKMHSNSPASKVLRLLKAKDAPEYVCKHLIAEKLEISETKAMQVLSSLRTQNKLDTCSMRGTCEHLPDGQVPHAIYYLKGKKLKKKEESTVPQSILDAAIKPATKLVPAAIPECRDAKEIIINIKPSGDISVRIIRSD